MKKIAVVINPKSKATVKSIDKVEQAFRAQGYEPELFYAASHHGIIQATKDAVRDGNRVVVAAGGDGTVSTVAAHLVSSGAALGVLPLGTFNNFAKHLGVPLDIDEAITTILKGEESLIDVGKINDHFFINNSSIGLYPQMVMRREGYERRGMSRFIASFLAIWKVLLRYPYLRVVFRINEKEFIRHTPLIFVGNGYYDYDGLDFGLRLSFNTGYLSLYVLQETHRLDLIKIMLKALFGFANREEKFEKFFVDEFYIDMPYRHTRVAKDGEILLLGSPLHYRRVQGALKVLLPRRES